MLYPEETINNTAHFLGLTTAKSKLGYARNDDQLRAVVDYLWEVARNIEDGGLSDATVFKLEEGLSWTMGGKGDRTRTENDMTMWRVARGAAGRLPPTGFPKSGKFS